MKATRRTSEERFWSQVDPTGFCWLWTGKLNVKGYGSANLAGQSNAHRAAYTLLVGPIPDGLELDHLCRVRTCVNPDHLEPVTRQQNVRRIPGVGDLYCGFTVHTDEPSNVYVTPRGTRQCRECKRIYGRRRVECDVCGRVMASSSISRHQRFSHREPQKKHDPVECPLCGVATLPGNQARHVRNIHPKETP